MKCVCLGDQQLGVASVSLNDQEAVWERIVDVVLERGADLVLHGGDVFEFASPAPEAIAAFRRPLNRLREAEIPMLLIPGNHDGRRRAVDAVDVFHDYPLLTIAQRPSIEYVAGVAVCCLPWVSPARIVAEHDLVVDRDRVNEYAAGLLVKIAGEMFHEAGSSQMPRVLLAHWAISGSSLPTGLPVDQLREPVLEWEALDEIGFDCIAASHIHQHQWLGSYSTTNPPTAFYTGSPQPLNHGEEKDVHGCYLVDLGETVTCRFIEIESRPFQTHDWDLTTHEGVFDLARLPWVEQGAIIRVRYRATDEQARRLDHEAMRRSLLEVGASKVTFEPEIVRAERARVAGVTESLGVDEALRAFCEAQGVEGSMVELMSDRLGLWRS